MDESGYDAEELFAPLLLDGKPSPLAVMTSVSDNINDPSVQIAVYDYSQEIDEKTNSGWQKWGNLADEYNAQAAEEDKGWERGDTALLGFRSVDAAVRFYDWVQHRDGVKLHRKGAADAALRAVDGQGNLVDGEGRLVTEKVGSVDDLRDEDFTSPSRSVELPELDVRVADAIGTGGKPVVIKKNIFERNAKAHGDLTAADSRDILKAALYTPTLYGQNQKTKRPYNWVLIKTRDAEGENRVVLLEVNENKDNVEIVHWHYVRDNALETIKRQAVREGGPILILPSEDSEEAGGLSSRTNNLSSEGKVSESSKKEQEIVGKNGVIRLQKGDDVVVSAEDAALRDAVVELMRGAGIDVVVDSEEGQRVLDMENGGVRLEEDMEGVNARFNDELGRYERGEMGENEMFHLGMPEGVMRGFLPELPIVMRQRVVRKASEKKHDVEVSALRNMPKMLAAPIFVFQRDGESLGVLTEMNDRKGRNVFVAFALQRNIQDGGDVFEVNDIRSIHGREHSNIIEPIKENGTLKWVDKEKGLNWLSSASSNYQQEIDSQDLSSAAKVVKDFENPKLRVEKRRFFRTEDGKRRVNRQVQN